MEYPAGLVCVRCGEIFGRVFNPSNCFATNAWDVKAIRDRCTAQLSEEKGITPKSPEDWARLLEGLV